MPRSCPRAKPNGGHFLSLSASIAAHGSVQPCLAIPVRGHRGRTVRNKMLAVVLLPGVQVHHASMPSRLAGGRKACRRTSQLLVLFSFRRKY